MPLGAEGEFALVQEQLQAALSRAGQPVKRGSMAHEHDVLSLLVEAALRLANVAGLEEYLPRLEQLALRDNHRLYLPVARRARGIVHRMAARHEQARADLNAALEQFTEQGMRWQAGRTLLELGELERASGSETGARASYTRALAQFEALGAKPDLARCQALLAALAEHPPSPLDWQE